MISAEQTSQTYFTPPSPPLAAIFLRMTPMVEGAHGEARLGQWVQLCE